MGFWGFVRANLWPAIVVAGGALMAVWGFVSDLREMWTAGLKPEFLQLSGFVVFAVGVVSVLFRQHQTIEARFAGVPSSVPVQVPLATPTPEAPVLPRKAREGSPRQVGRQYAPDAFVEGYLDLLDEGPTDYQRDAYLRPHIGLWLQFSAFLVASTNSGERAYVAIARRENSSTWVWLFFGAEWKAQLAAIKKGAPIRLETRIEMPRADHIELASSELL